MAIPKGTVIPKATGNLMKFETGKNKIRVLSDVRVGWEGWKDNKPFRHEGGICKITPEMVDMSDSEKSKSKPKPKINYFWVMAVWNYGTEKVEVLEITQKTIMSPLYNLELEEEWGDLKGYDINITKTGEKLTTKFDIQGVPPKLVSKDILKAYDESDISDVIGDMFDMEVEEDEDFITSGLTEVN